MIKKLKHYFRKRKEQKLRKWCVLRAEKVSRSGEELANTAGFIYNWITEG